MSSTLEELAAERTAAREAVERLRLTPVLFELGARPHAPRDLYRAYLDQSDVFVGIYSERYGWIAPGESTSGLEDEYVRSGYRPKLIYIKRTARRDPRLDDLLGRVRADDIASYREFATADELRELIENDLAILLTERFELSAPSRTAGPGEPVPTNVPVPRSPLVGRHRELAAASELLGGAGAHLVTVTGVGGCGKSRLGLEVAVALLDHFEDGTFLVMLESVRDPAMVVEAIAEALGVREVPGRPRLETVCSHLRDAHALLLLDNFEHVVEAAPTVSTLLEACPRLSVLATSRTPLRVRGEHEVPLPPLETPADWDGDLESLSQFEAVAFFLQRARDARADFTVTTGNAATIAEICRRLDGLPLAIELATARLKVLSPETLLARLASRFEVLRGGTRDLPERHRTLRRTIDWSHDLLDEAERRMLRRLATFAGGATLEAAEAVCALEHDLAADALDVIASLIDSSMLTTTVGDDGDMRIDMLETIRAYATERLLESGELEQIRRRHAEFFAVFAEQAQPRLVGAEESRWFDRLAAERENLRNALDWSVEEEVELGLRLCASLWRFWESRSGIVEGHDRLAALLAQPSPATLVRAKALRAAAALGCYVGEYATARAYLEESLPIFQEIGDEGHIAKTLNEMGVLASHEGDHATARRLLEESLHLKRGLGDDWLIANTLVNLGLLAGWEGDHARAYDLAADSLHLYGSVDDEVGVAIATGNLAHAAMHLGKHDEAVGLQVESLRLFGLQSDADGSAECLERLGLLVNACSDRHAAARLFGLAAVTRVRAGTRPSLPDRAELERGLESARATLGDEAWNCEWQNGRTMSVDEAIELARTVVARASEQAGNLAP